MQSHAPAGVKRRGVWSQPFLRRDLRLRLTRRVFTSYSTCDALATGRSFGVQMFVCNCNGVRQRDMSAAVDHVASCGAPTVAAVYAQCGVAPKCGRCKVDIQRMLDEAMRPAMAMAAE